MTTFAFDLAQQTVAFLKDQAAQEAWDTHYDGYIINEWNDLYEMSGFQLCQLHNAIARELNSKRPAAEQIADVKKFATKGAAEDRIKRLIGELFDLRGGAAQFAAPEPVKAPAAEVITVTYSSVDGHTDTRKFKTLAGAQRFAAHMVGETPEMGRTYAASCDGIGKVTVQGATLAELFTRPERKEAASEVQSDRWRRVKREEPQKVAYRPLPGSVQDGLYQLLTASPALTMEEYCARASELNTSDRTLFVAPQVWGALRYLFVTKRGYGLDFDGTHIRLIVPADERPAK